MRELRQIDLDLSTVETSHELHDLLFEQLSFPDYYGSNWDAFWDVIRDDKTLPDVLVLHGWSAFQDRLPRDAQHLRRALEALCQEPDLPACRVVYA